MGQLYFLLLCYMVVKMLMVALWIVMLCGLVCGNQRLGRTYHHHLQGRYVDRGLWNVSNHYKTTQHHIQKPIADTFPAVRT